MEWKDRVPTKANRKKITFEDTTLGTKYATVEYADEPSEVGTALNRANLLQGFNNVECVSKMVTLSSDIVGSRDAPVTSHVVDIDFGYIPAGFILLGISNSQTLTRENIQGATTSNLTTSVQDNWLCGSNMYSATVSQYIDNVNVAYRISSQNNSTIKINIGLSIKITGNSGSVNFHSVNVMFFHFLVFKKPIE